MIIYVWIILKIMRHRNAAKSACFWSRTGHYWLELYRINCEAGSDTRRILLEIILTAKQERHKQDNQFNVWTMLWMEINFSFVLNKSVLTNVFPHSEMSFYRPKKTHLLLIATCWPTMIPNADRQISNTWYKLSLCLQKTYPGNEKCANIFNHLLIKIP